MKKLYGDNLISKIRSCPAPIMVLLLIISYFFANAYYMIIIGEEVSYQAIQAYSEVGLNYNLNPLGIGIIYTIIAPCIYTIIIEILRSITYSIITARGFAQINKSDYSFRFRYTFIIANIIIGILSIGYFFTQKYNGVYTGTIAFYSGIANNLNESITNPYYAIQTHCLPFIVRSIMILCFSDDLMRRFIPHSLHKKVFALFMEIYLSISGIYLIIQTMNAFVLHTTTDVYVIAAFCVDWAAKIIITGIYLLYYFKVLNKKVEVVSNEINITFNENEEQKKDDNIYDDFNF